MPISSIWAPNFSWCSPPPEKKNVVSYWSWKRFYLFPLWPVFVGTFV